MMTKSANLTNAKMVEAAASSIRRLDARSAQSMLFPGGPSQLSWIPWEKPLHSLPIDDSVQFLRKSRREPKLRSPAALAKADVYYGFCPFYWARSSVVLSAAVASEELEKREHIRQSSASPKRWKRIRVLLEKAADELSKFDGGSVRQFTHPYFVTDGLDETEVLEAKRLALAEALRDGMALAESEKNRLVPPHRDGDVWKQVFVISLGYTWHGLTGAVPNGTAFRQFIENGHASLGGGGENWDSQIKIALARNKAMPACHHFLPSG
jgi:hypothetical protein